MGETPCVVLCVSSILGAAPDGGASPQTWVSRRDDPLKHPAARLGLPSVGGDVLWVTNCGEFGGAGRGALVRCVALGT